MGLRDAVRHPIAAWKAPLPDDPLERTAWHHAAAVERAGRWSAGHFFAGAVSVVTAAVANGSTWAVRALLALAAYVLVLFVVGPVVVRIMHFLYAPATQRDEARRMVYDERQENSDIRDRFARHEKDYQAEVAQVRADADRTWKAAHERVQLEQFRWTLMAEIDTLRRLIDGIRSKPDDEIDRTPGPGSKPGMWLNRSSTLVMQALNALDRGDLIPVVQETCYRSDIHTERDEANGLEALMNLLRQWAHPLPLSGGLPPKPEVPTP